MATFDRPFSEAGVDREAGLTHLQSFLRGELSALETYRIALKNLDDPILFKSLSQIESDHQRHVRVLQERIRALGGIPSTDSGVWGGWSRFVTTASGWFGDKAAIKSLKEGEEHGLKDYRDHLNEIDAETRRLVQNELIPEQEAHIKFIDSMLEQR